MSINGEREIPALAYAPGEEIGVGWESIVRELGPDWVIKEVNPFDNDGEKKPKSESRMRYLRSEERAVRMSHEQQRLQQIFGEEHFERMYFIKTADEKGEEIFLMIQKRVHGANLNAYIKREDITTEQFIKENREQLMELAWGAKKAFIEFGMPLDFHIGNMIREEATGNIKIVDTGEPARGLERLSGEIKPQDVMEIMERTEKRLNTMRTLEDRLELSPEEVKALNEKYDIDESEFGKRVEFLQGKKKEAEAQLAKERKEREEALSQFLDGVMDGNDTTTGRRVHEAALKLVEGMKVNKKTQEHLDELEKNADVAGDKAYWTEFLTRI
ncbi:hypothetical protein C4561_03540 [candidate division WWE3 bacterium]|jgi:hypothetical protein|uniref:Uncharacterized protein n=1 Tax=candidate division WWE3 bacterium TaxID=2053526 RepID=A0A3A4ZJU3_UNCKA|nr:MAG: hypothetical protein C4561_03540 [candidate division WWE3 bacterium]